MGLLIPITQDIIIPRAQYPAYVSRYEEKEDRNSKEPYIYIYFQITAGQLPDGTSLAGHEVFLRAPKKVSPRAPLSRYIGQIGIAINDQMGKNFDMDWILNKPVILTISPKPWRGQTFNNIEAIVPYAAPAPGTSLVGQQFTPPAPTMTAPVAPMPMAPPQIVPTAPPAMAAPSWPPAPAMPGAQTTSKVTF